MQKYQYIDLFSGCGGLSLGLHLSQKWNGLFAIEKDPNAFKTLYANLIEKTNHFSWVPWLDKTNHDINEVLAKHQDELKKLKGKVHLVAGGPPCQGFSFAGRRKKADLRNKLIHSYLHLVELVEPQMILFENVEGFNVGFKKKQQKDFLGKIERGEPYSKVLLARLKKLGYKDAKFEMIDFSEYGVPQERVRFIIVATRKGNSDLFFTRLAEQRETFLRERGLPLGKITIKDAISDLLKSHGIIPSPDSKRFWAGAYGEGNGSTYQKLMRKDSKSEYPDSHRFANHRPSTVAKFSRIIDEQMTPRQIKENFDSKKASTSLLNADKPSPTLTTLPDDHVHYCEPRIFTVREYARIQSFPDYFEFKGKYTTGGERRTQEVPRYSQLGNAIPPLFGEFCGKILGGILDEA